MNVVGFLNFIKNAGVSVEFYYASYNNSIQITMRKQEFANRQEIPLEHLYFTLDPGLFMKKILDDQVNELNKYMFEHTLSNPCYTILNKNGELI